MKDVVFFRADSNPQIASGHIMRCIAIAQEFVKKGSDVMFINADSYSVQMLENAGLRYVVLDTRWDHLEDEIEIVKSILQDHQNPLLIIDTYSVTRSYVEGIMPYAQICYIGSKLEYFGDIKVLLNYSVDIDYDFYESNYSNNTKLLLGTSYVPLREEFLFDYPRQSNSETCRILLTTGNTNPNHYVEKIIKKIVSSAVFKMIELEVVIGGMYEDAEDLEKRSMVYNNIHFHRNVMSMAILMHQCDLAISANGTTVYELAASKVPTITFAMVEEQLRAARKLSNMNVVDYCGEIFLNTEECINTIIKKVAFYVMSPDSRRKLSERAYKIIDGKGCERIVTTLLHLH